MIQIKQKPIEIDIEKPFEGDFLEREEEIKNLSNLVTKIETPFVLSISSPWGTGKTTFTLMLKAYLQQKGVVSFYFNAWETDFSEDPLIAFLGEINTEITTLLNSDEKLEVWEKTKKTGQYIAKKSIPTLVKLATGGIIDLDSDIEKEILSVTEDIANDAIDLYESKKSAIKLFKDNLEEVVSKIYDTDDKDTPLVIFIDELDRCNPIYAINLLERIKHILNIPRVIFVLSIDRIQLTESIRNVYGSGFNSNVYLKRFIDLEYQLSKSSPKQFIENLVNYSYFDSFFKNREEYEELKYDKPYLINSLNLISKGFGLTLRDIEQLISKIYLALLSTEQKQYLHPPLLVFLLALKDFNYQLYKDFKEEKDVITKIIELLYGFSTKEERISSFETMLLEGLLLNVSSDLPGTVKIVENHNNVVEQANLPYQEKEYSERVMYIYGKGAGNFRNKINISIIFDKIEMTQKFSR